MNCLLGDAGIAIGLTSLPFRQEVEFYEQEIANSLFPNYKNAVRKHLTGDLAGDFESDFQQYFYEPVPYYLFGSFDLAVISLVDDFEMMARTFRPFDPMLSRKEDKGYRENFFYKVITGPTPQFRPEDSIVNIAARTFLGEARLPLFAMSLLKLNNALLLGNGTDFMRLVVRYINAKRQTSEDPNLQVILLESYSAHEITLLIFSTSYSTAARLITSLREARVWDLIKPETSVLRPEELGSMLENSLLASLEEMRTERQDLRSAPLFSDTESYFGFDFRLLDPKMRHLLGRIDAEDSLDLYCQWSVKPGHLKTSKDEVAEGGDGNVSTVIGRGDLFEQSKGSSTRHVIEQVLVSLNTESLPRHARRRQTMPALSVVPELAMDEDTDENYTDPDLSRMCFSVGEIKIIQDHLRAVWAPKILTGKVLNAFTNFNDGILDPSLYGYFLELLPFMELIQRLVAIWHAPLEPAQLGLICATLEKVTDNFERAYRNRFYNSYRMGDITDFNLDFKGGIQQLLTSFDAAYKAICSVLGRQESFVYVAGSPGVYSTRYEVRLNYYHVFQPEIFGCIANHEAANFYLARPGTSLPPFARAVGLSIPDGRDDSDQDNGIVLMRLREMNGRADFKQARLLPLVTSELFNCVFVDLLAFYFGYNRNGQLFAHWYWGYFAQNSVAYSRSGKVDEVQFVGFLLRMLWIEKISRVPQTNPVPFGNRSFDLLWQRWRPILSDFLDWLDDDDEINKWNTAVRTHVESRFLEVYRGSDVETIEHICETTEQQAAELKTKLAGGEVCLYTRTDDRSKFRFTEQLFYAYLSLLRDRFGKGGILLTRREDGRPELNSSNAKALFDPIGGIFTHDAVTRRERFRYRAGLTMSLWDMAQKEKKQVVLTRLRRSA